MAEDAGTDLKVRLRADLRVAMKDRRTLEANVIRALVAAIDNAEAVPRQDPPAASAPDDFHSRSAEVERLLLDSHQVRQLLLAEIQEREHAAVELERLGKTDRAAALQAEACYARRYLA